MKANINTRKNATITVVIAFFVMFLNSGNIMSQNITFSYDDTNELTQYYDVTNLTEAEKYYAEGLRYDLEDNLEEAVKRFSKAIACSTNYIKAFDKRGVAYTKMCKFGKAIKDFNIVIEMNPNSAEGYSHRGIVYYCIDNYAKAKADYTKAIELDINYAKAYYNRGLLQLEMDDKEAALSDLKSALDLKYMVAAEIISQYNLASY
jgi:tetratricopeptide (TPR) repeat protein